MLGGEADARQHLLAVAGRGPGRPPGERLGHAGRSRGRGPPRRRRAGRRQPPGRRGCRPGGGGRPGRWRWVARIGCAPARARGRARASPAPRRRAREPRASCPRATAPAQSTGSWTVARADIECRPSPRPVPAPGRGRAPAAAAAPRLPRRALRPPPWSWPPRVPSSERPNASVPNPCTTHRSPLRSSRWVAGPQRGQDDSGADDWPSPARRPAASRARPRWRASAPRHSKRTETAVAAVGVQRVGPSQIVERAVERGAARCLGGVPDAALEERPLRRLHQRSAPRSRRRRAMMLRWTSALPP